MFYHIEGKLVEVGQNLAVIDCGGVGYALNVTLNTLSYIKLGEKTKLYVSEIIKEDAFDLYGFYTKSEKRCFEMLVSVSGIGPKAALSILSANTPEGLALAIMNNNEKALTVAPGIGKKIAQRVILELKDKIAKEQAASGLTMRGGTSPAAPAFSNKATEAAAALAVLGYSSQEVSEAMKGVDVENLSLEEIIRQSLKKMVR